MFDRSEIMSRAHDIRRMHKTTFSVALAQSWREAKELRYRVKQQVELDVYNVLRGRELELV